MDENLIDDNLIISQIDFDELFIKKFDDSSRINDSIPKKYRTNKELWCKIRDEYLMQSAINSNDYKTCVEEYQQIILLRKNGIYISSKNDRLGELSSKMALIISKQKILYNHFLQYITHLLEDNFETKSMATSRSRRTRRKL